MTDISVRNLVKAFEVDKNILDGLTFEITQGERVGILGKNGTGKTTLFRILAGEFDSDEGTFSIPAGKRLGLISQIPKYPENYVVDDVLRTAHEHLYRMNERMTRLTETMSEDTPKAVLNEYDSLMAEFERLGGYDMDAQRGKVANGLDIPLHMREQLFSDLSGGEKTRVNLARLILEDTDILLLDEPTNHLDMRATEWLEDYLLSFKGTVLAISHDRYFLDRVTQRTIEIVAGKAEIYSGNYSFYVVERQRRFEEQQRSYEKEQAEAKRLKKSAERLRAWGTGNEMLMKKAKAVESRIERTVKTERPTQDKKLRVSFKENEFYGDEVLYVENLGKAFGEKTLFAGLEAQVRPGERIALVGDNGSGKSTLISIIMEETSADAGKVKIGPSVRAEYLPQVIRFANVNRSVLDTVMYEDNCSHQAARDRLGSFGFSGEDVFKGVWALSGGELSRLRLCMLMKAEINFLILDEPTNHLDISSREWIEEALENYGETLLFVSHDRYFIDKFATRVWELSGGVFTDYRGTFAEYREYRERVAQPKRNDSKKGESKKKENKKQKTVSTEKLLQRVEKEIENVEAAITELDALIQEHSTDYVKLLEISDERTGLEGELDALYERWEELSG